MSDYTDIPEHSFSVINLVDSDEFPYFILNSKGQIELGCFGVSSEPISRGVIQAQIGMLKENVKQLEFILAASDNLGPKLSSEINNPAVAIRVIRNGFISDIYRDGELDVTYTHSDGEFLNQETVIHSDKCSCDGYRSETLRLRALIS